MNRNRNRAGGVPRLFGGLLSEGLAGRFALALVGFGLGALSACKTLPEGELNPNQAPETIATYDTIIRTGDNRLSTTVDARWSGTDPDGYVQRFELSTSGPQGPWASTLRQDSQITFTVPAGMDTADFALHVRAVDNEGLADPSPARTTFPVRNAPPSVRYRYPDTVPANSPFVGGQPRYSLPALRYTLQPADPDGVANIEGLALVWNDTTSGSTFDVPTTAFATDDGSVNIHLVATQPDAATTPTNVRLGTSLAVAGTLTGLNTNSVNVLYARTTDRSGARSAWVAARPVYVKRVSAPVLLVNLASSGVDTLTAWWAARATEAGLTFDTLELLRRDAVSGKYVGLAPDAATQAEGLAFYGRIIMFGNTSVPLDVGLAYGEGALQPFLAKGGKVLLSGYLGSSSVAVSPSYGYSPLDSVGLPPTGSSFYVSDTAQAFPAVSGLPVLRHVGFNTAARYLIPLQGTTVLYRMNIVKRTNGVDVLFNAPIAAMRSYPSGARFGVMVYELPRLNGLGNAGTALQGLTTQLGF